MQNITPFLWFENQAEEAANFYVSIFANSKIESTMPGPDDKVIVVSFNLNGLSFAAINGGPQYKFSPANSYVIHCNSQEEVDHYWDKLLEGGKSMACGWLDDKYGVTWQIIPNRFFELLSAGTEAQTMAVMTALWEMVKIEIAPLEKAFESAAG